MGIEFIKNSYNTRCKFVIVRRNKSFIDLEVDWFVRPDKCSNRFYKVPIKCLNNTVFILFIMELGICDTNLVNGLK